MNPLDNMTVAVTNFHRPQLLDRALKSIRDARIRRVVIAAICPEKQVLSVIEQHRNSQPWLSFDVAVVREDIGCNATWMLAAYRCRTERILILHDDDLLAKEFGQTYCDLISPALDSGVGFATWCAGLYLMNGQIYPAPYRVGPGGILPASKLFEVVGTEGRFSLSPVVGLLNRGIVIDACKESEQTLTQKESTLRPGMLLGTEIIVYLRHIKAFTEWLYVDKVLAYYGHHTGSGTVQAQQAHREGPLIVGYDIARRQAANEKPALTPRLILAYNDYEPKNPEIKRRNTTAQETWHHHFSKSGVIPFPIAAADVTRSGNDIGDTGTLLYVRDIFDIACACARPEDIITYVNSDIGLTTLAHQRIIAGVTRGRGVTVCPRRMVIPRRTILIDTVTKFRADTGLDVFAFTAKWWREVGRVKMPDMLIGREAWDSCFATIAEEWADEKPVVSDLIRTPSLWSKSRAYTDDVCWHHPHASDWYSAHGHGSWPGQIHNRSLALTFFIARGDMKMVKVLSLSPMSAKQAEEIVAHKHITRKPTVCVFTICWNEAEMMPYFLRHYSTFADKIVVYDGHSTDGTREIVKACPIAELRDWDSVGLNDVHFIEAVNTRYRETRGKFDWVAWPDVDELLWHPYILEMLKTVKADMLQATAFAMISETNPNGNDGQIYDTLRMGVRQPNYDKYILWRAETEIVHLHGRHTYESEWPQCRGIKSCVPELKLLHYHYFGVEHTERRNKRNFDRAIDKKWAWNCDAPANSNKDQVGGTAWVKAAMDEKRLIEVLPAPGALKKLHLGSGWREIPGYESHDMDVNITKPLPFKSASASHIFAEHVVEHVTHREAWSFFEECYRVLAPGCVVRIGIPDFVRLANGMTQEYQNAVKAGGSGDGSARAAKRAVVFDHGHQAVWCQQLLAAFLSSIGFNVELCECGKSKHPEFNDIEQHWKLVGRGVAELETGVVEGTKPS